MNRFEQALQDLVKDEIERQVVKRIRKTKEAQRTAESELKDLHEKHRSLKASFADEHRKAIALEERLGTADANLARANITIRSLQDQAIIDQKAGTV
jgi:predicted  nucleic acid-binding Zn-ribbon protein